MSEIDSLGSNMFYSGVQNSTNEALKKRKNEKSSGTKRTKFGELLKSSSEQEPSFVSKGLPPEINGMSFDEAAIYLKDAVDMAGNVLEQEINNENIQNFKKAVSQFITFVVENNFEVVSKQSRRKVIVSPVNFFSTYNTKGHLADPKVQINVINEKLDLLAQSMLDDQKNNLKILQQVDEIKGLIVDLMSS